MARGQWLKRVVLVAGMFVHSGASAASLKCGTELVTDGDTRVEVRSKCGDPADKSTRRMVVRQRIAPGQEIYVEVEIEEWTYTYGPHRFDQVVIFENGRLADVRSGEYGR